MCGVPVLVSNVPQMQKIVDEYRVGKTVDISNPDEIIATINDMTNENTYNQLVQNCALASEQLNWEKEFVSIINILNQWR
jgi:glycosyltransferase involved in cell wall biosynthesis